MNRARIFLCHASDDKKEVRLLYRRLLTDGFLPWLEEFNLLGGQRRESEIQKAISESTAVVVLLSTSSASKDSCFFREIDFALKESERRDANQDTFVIPASTEEVSLPENLAGKHCILIDSAPGYRQLRRSLACLAKDAELATHLPASWALPFHLLQAPLDKMNEVQVREWLADVGDDPDIYPEERNQSWPKTYTHACEVKEHLVVDEQMVPDILDCDVEG
jgi:hypothetical protein